MVKAVLFDFGGVLADEGFREGLKAIGRWNGFDADHFFHIADALIYETGYLTGMADEFAYWNALRQRTGLKGSDWELREEILKRFVLRPEMLAAVDRLRSEGFITALLSDQTNWLDEIEVRTPLFPHFDRTFNSFHIHKSKRDSSVFPDVCRSLGVAPEESLFIDDNLNHIQRAASQGLNTILFTDVDDFEERIKEYVTQDELTDFRQRK